MRTNIDIDDELMAQALQASGKSTKKDVVDAALRLLIQVGRQTGVRRLRGKIEFYDDVMEERRRKDLEFEEPADGDR